MHRLRVLGNETVQCSICSRVSISLQECGLRIIYSRFFHSHMYARTPGTLAFDTLLIFFLPSLLTGFMNF